MEVCKLSLFFKWGWEDLEKSSCFGSNPIICNIWYTLVICLSISEINMFKPNGDGIRGTTPYRKGFALSESIHLEKREYLFLIRVGVVGWCDGAG